MELLFSEREM